MDKKVDETMEETNDQQQEVASSHTESPAEERTETEANAEQPTEQTNELEQLRALAEENNQRLLRAQADFDNFRKRTLKEKEELAKYASMKLIDQLLPVVDNFERALQAGQDNPEMSSFSKGVDMIFRQFLQVLEQEGLQAMNAVGQPFNPEFHQAIMQVESDDHEEGIVVEEVQKGYMLKDKVLRPAMVKVSG
ncbi:MULTISPECIES: nucleotide exchange factor GrpE [unclassified Paenibacillus]|uniref:nucleotide exchange factor GrpE n=1 Tax=unclassified Paenibacillus TaxID=185978 RepID=UPI001C0FC74F|nr:MULTISPECIES: nucleotide exchange factor GrpE [unclassified Paenibacillus]MBU5440436.1 nucleotide exchange factor GrpE [Paenibacillus sp. MSJ-34]